MKRIYILILGLLLLLPLQGQILRYSNYAAPAPDTTNYYATYKTVYDAMSVPPGHDTAHFQSSLVQSLDEAGYWDRMSLFYVFAGRNATDALINWINPGTYDADNVSETAWTQWQGFIGDGVADYISTNFAPNSDSTHYKNNSASVGIYLMVNQQEAAGVLGANYSTTAYLHLIPRNTSNQVSGWVNSESSVNILETHALSSAGCWILSRTASNATEVYRDGGSVKAEADESSDIPAAEFYILKRNGSTLFSTNRVAVFWIMDGVSDAEADAVNDIVETYMDAIGTGVQ